MRDYGHWTTDELRRIDEMRQQGLSWKAVAERFGRSVVACQKAFYRWVDDMGKREAEEEK